jgi:HNH endonuclease
VNIREIAYFNEQQLWIMNKDRDLFRFFSRIECGPHELKRDRISYKIRIRVDVDGVERTVDLIAPLPIRVMKAKALTPEVLFHMGQNTLVEGEPFLLFAAHKIFEVRDYAWDADALEKSKLWVTARTLGESMEKRELSKQVENLIAATSESKAPTRQQIPDDVKLAVWARDGQACVVCQSKQELQFDHIIPFSLGGSSTAENIQLLCRFCNLKKTDKIVF